MTRIVFSLIALALCAQAAGQTVEDPHQCAAGVSDPFGELTYEGEALVGFDKHGKALVAIDTDGDGLADLCLLVTASTRLTPERTQVADHRLQRAHIVYAWDHRHADRPFGELRVMDHAGTFAFAAVMDGYAVPDLSGSYDASMVVGDAIEIALQRAEAPAPGETDTRVPLANMTAFSLASGWPAAFAYDAHDPASAGPCGEDADDEDCIAGGAGASSCSFTSEGIGSGGPCQKRGSCSVTCGAGRFACCFCEDTSGFFGADNVNPKCRCRVCADNSGVTPPCDEDCVEPR